MKTLPLAPTHIARQTGLSLVELMVAVTLSLLLTVGVIQIFMSSKQTYSVQDALSRLQENARFALDFLTYDMRMAGYLGCDAGININSQVNNLPVVGAGFEAYDDYADLGAQVSLYTGTHALANSDVVAGTDVLMVKGASSAGADLIEDMADATSASAIVVNRAMADGLFQNGELVMVSDCLDAEIFAVTSVTEVNADAENSIPASINIGHAELLKPYSTAAGAQLMPLNYALYYVGTDTQQQPNLYREVLSVNETGQVIAVTEPLVRGVEDFQITYGERLDALGNNLRYVDPTASGFDPDRVVAIRFDLLMATEAANVATDTQSYWLGDQWTSAAADDRRLFRSFRHTIQLRNKDIEL